MAQAFPTLIVEWSADGILQRHQSVTWRFAVRWLLEQGPWIARVVWIGEEGRISDVSLVGDLSKSPAK